MAIFRKIEGYTYENELFVHLSASKMYTHGFLFEFFFFILFSLMTVAFASATRVSRERLGQILGFFVTLGFMKLTFDAACRTYGSLTT